MSRRCQRAKGATIQWCLKDKTPWFVKKASRSTGWVTREVVIDVWAPDRMLDDLMWEWYIEARRRVTHHLSIGETDAQDSYVGCRVGIVFKPDSIEFNISYRLRLLKV